LQKSAPILRLKFGVLILGEIEHQFFGKHCAPTTFYFGKKFGEINPCCQFRQHFLGSFFVQKCFARLILTYSLDLCIFGKRVLAQKLLVKFW